MLRQNWAEWSGILLIIIILMALGACGSKPEAPAYNPPIRVKRAQVTVTNNEDVLEPSSGAFKSAFDGAWKSGCNISENRKFAYVRVEQSFDRDVLKSTREYFSIRSAPYRCDKEAPAFKTVKYERMTGMKLVEDGRYRIYFAKDTKEYHRDYDFFTDGLILNLDEGMKLNRLPAPSTSKP